MSRELIELIGACVVAIVQVYAISGYDFPFLAWLWDVIAKACGHTANVLGFMAMHARKNYYIVVNSYGN